jgi:two-component system sensor histidine kinase GlrK
MPAKLTLFSRTVLGYLIFVVLVSAVSIFSIQQLNEVNKVTRSITLFDDTLLGFYEQLTNTLFSETRNEKKFLIMQDDALFDRYQQAKQDFDQQLFEVIAMTKLPEARESLYTINRLHHRFGELFAEEVELMKEAAPYDKVRYEAEKEEIANTILEELKLLRVAGEKNVIRKIMALSEKGVRASNIAVIITAVSLLFGLVLSIVATRGITIPLKAMKRQTREIAAGDLDGHLQIDSPPEIAELAASFNFMRQRLKEVDTLKSDFFSLMSHELRTPLTSIKEGTNMLLEGLGGEITEKQGRLLRIIAEESNRLIKLVNSLLDLTKMEAGMLEYHFAHADPARLIQQCMTEILPLAESKHIKIQEDIGDSPAVRVDTERILQVLRNLVGNAVKFTPEGGRITVAVQGQKNGIEITVRDSGPGIPAEHVERIFGRFQQLLSETNVGIKGTGLGLAIVKNIVQAHGGKVWVESEVGQGSTFFVFLPA